MSFTLAEWNKRVLAIQNRPQFVYLWKHTNPATGTIRHTLTEDPLIPMQRGEISELIDGELGMGREDAIRRGRITFASLLGESKDAVDTPLVPLDRTKFYLLACINGDKQRHVVSATPTTPLEPGEILQLRHMLMAKSLEEAQAGALKSYHYYFK